MIHELRQEEVSVWPSHGHEGGRENLLLLGGRVMLRLHTLGVLSQCFRKEEALVWSLLMVDFGM